VTGEDNNTSYYFSTQTDGSSTAKSPKGMFEEKLIPNDLSLVAESINSYYQ